MTFPKVGVADWRAQVDKELAGASFDKTLVHTTPEGVAIQPLYVEATADSGVPGAAPFTRGNSVAPPPFAICMRHDRADADALAADLDGGADGLWLQLGRDFGLDSLFARADWPKLQLVLDGNGAPLAALDALLAGADRANVPSTALRVVVAADPLADIARGLASGTVEHGMAELVECARHVHERCPASQGALVSTLPYHEAGADAADELAIALSTAVAYLRALTDGGFDVAAAAKRLAVQLSVGRDTFGELCKLRALRLVWHKLYAAAGAPDEPLAKLHAVASPRTLSERDPWVNMLRVTTEVFSAVLGGADLVTPAPFDDALGAPSDLGRRVARNTGLVLRAESHLGRVVDAAGGSYYLETLTDQLARVAWQRFRAIEAEGGIIRSLQEGKLQARLVAGWHKWSDGLAKRKEAITGVSVFANLDEKRPQPAHAHATHTASSDSPWPPLPRHRDAEAFERLRDRADELGATAPTVGLVVLGPAAEYRPRLTFASSFFGGGGLRAREVAADVVPAFACLCGSEERYAAEAADRARALKAAGCSRVLLAGRPGALEASLREAGVDGFIFVGCDVVKTLAELLGAQS
jgi:methylmalonyl-CoA mutase